MVRSDVEQANRIDVSALRRQATLAEVFLSPQVDSTNRWAIELAGNEPGVDTPCLFVTNVQTAGRGRSSKTWTAGIGSLTFSLLTRRPDDERQPCDSATAGLLPLALAAQLCRVIDPLLATTGGAAKTMIKWPNDLYLTDRKLSGCLIEPVPGRRDLIVAGCGVNVNNRLDGVPGAVSLMDVVGQPVDLTQLLSQVAGAFVSSLDCPESLADNQLIEFCRQRDWLRGRRLVWSQGEREIRAAAGGVTDDGGLVLLTDGGTLTVHSGSIRTDTN